MNKFPFRKKFKYIWISLIIILASCSIFNWSENKSIVNLPGGYSFAEGVTDYPLLYQKALRYLSKNDYVRAEETYRDLIEKEPENSNGYIGLGASLIYQERYHEAITAYLQALDLNENATQAMVGLGSTYSKLEDYQSALEYYAKAIELDGDEINAEMGMAIAKANLGYQKEEIIKHLERIIEINPSSQLAEQAETWKSELNSNDE